MKANPKNRAEIEMEHFRDIQKAIRSIYLRKMAAAEMFKEAMYLIKTIHGDLAEAMHELYATKRGGLNNNGVLAEVT